MTCLPRIFVYLFLALAAAPQEHHHDAAMMDNPSRDVWQKPANVVKALGIRPTDVVADIGAGSGYFTRRFAAVAEKVFAVDTDGEALAAAAKSSPANVTTVLASPDDPRLAPESVDLIFICDTLHHIENRPAYYLKLIRALKHGGRIAIIDFKAGWLQEEAALKELDNAGFTVSDKLDFLARQYYIIVRPSENSR